MLGFNEKKQNDELKKLIRKTKIPTLKHDNYNHDHPLLMILIVH